MARLSGKYGHTDALKLAGYTQAPDQIKQFDAAALFNATKDSSFTSTDWKTIAPDVPESEQKTWCRDIYVYIHSLTSTSNHGDLRDQHVDHWRTGLESAFREAVAKKGEDRFKYAGVILHAYGDAFAHTYRAPALTLYGPNAGHLSDRHDPDQIWTHGDAYREYVEHLAVLFEVPEENRKFVAQFLDGLDKDRPRDDPKEIARVAGFQPRNPHGEPIPHYSYLQNTSKSRNTFRPEKEGAGHGGFNIEYNEMKDIITHIKRHVRSADPIVHPEIQGKGFADGDESVQNTKLKR